LWQDPAVKPQTEYTYFVLAYNSYKSPSPDSNRVKIFWDNLPSAPEAVIIRSENQALEITWKFSPPRMEEGAAIGFNLYRRAEGDRFGFFPLNPEPVKETRFVDGGLQNGKKYFYEVRAVRNVQGTFIEGPASGVAEGIPEKQIPPSPPRGLVAVFQESGVALRWDENPEPDVVGYDAYRRAEGEETFRKINPTLIKELYFLDPSADPKTSYTYRLKAVDSSRTPKESDFSQDAVVSPLPVK
jgi:fibronectin type 3 domain-containing protein